ncbi:hypothetical protein PsorP6_015703 [Peronosclerospora sorghi]|uniref:Uncharacterized protein n=1 Tax=Peronosclerospora sorghi TaxID=230839 RepID=A0ACC0WQM8_9STRA|nr:hypothetical protein PsorP6_015703 [Peronosclerospora sorghi]
MNESGGQPFDTGTINSVSVDQVYVKDGRCLHRVLVTDEDPPPFVEDGQDVIANVEWVRRFDHMQQHSAQPLLCAMGTIHQHGRLEKNAAMWSSCRWMEVKMGRTFKEKTLTFKEVMQKIENDVNEAIVAGLATTPSFEKAGTDEWKNIASKVNPKEMPEVMRIGTIEGLDVNPCCGTHVQNLAQLRSLRVLHTEIARGAFRVWFVARFYAPVS